MRIARQKLVERPARLSPRALRDEFGEEPGLAFLRSGKDHVVAGSPKNKVQVAAAQVIADKATAALHGSMAKPGSGKE